jgi:hypothetical protein
MNTESSAMLYSNEIGFLKKNLQAVRINNLNFIRLSANNVIDGKNC